MIGKDIYTVQFIILYRLPIKQLLINYIMVKLFFWLVKILDIEFFLFFLIIEITHPFF